MLACMVDRDVKVFGNQLLAQPVTRCPGSKKQRRTRHVEMCMALTMWQQKRQKGAEMIGRDNAA